MLLNLSQSHFSNLSFNRLGAPFIEEAGYLRDTNEQAWRWEYLGEIVGTGGAVFDNVHDAHLSDDRIRGFERIRNGIDWGWFPMSLT